MTRRTVVRDRLTTRARMAAVVAAETARRIAMPKIIGMASPGQTHVREDVMEVDRCHFLARLLHQAASRFIDGRVIRPIEIVNFVRNTLLCDLAGRIIYLQN